MRALRIIFTALLATLLVSIALPAQAQAKGPEPVGLRPDSPDYAKHGPFWVGYRPLVIGEGTTHKLDAHLWYPALNPKGDKEEITYKARFKGSSWPADLPTDVYGHALLNAAIDTTKQPYPLIVFSHWFTGDVPTFSTLIEHYASQGFVVIAPEHIEQGGDPASSEIWKASIDRPRDIKQSLDYAEKITAVGGDMAGLIDMKHVAVVGQSYGGYTALAMAGAQYDLDAFNARCAALPKDDPNAFLCTPLVHNEADMAARAGLNPIRALLRLSLWQATPTCLTKRGWPR
jgi:hypothetical protein